MEREEQKMNYFSVLLIGDWGTGKTTAASTAPKPVLYLDVDNKLHRMANMQALLKGGALIQWPIAEPLSRYGLSRLAITKVEEGRGKGGVVQRPEGYIKLCGMIERLEKDKCIVDGKKIETVVLDSYTSANEHIKRLILAVNQAITMSQPLWGALLTNFEELNNTLLRLPCNVIMICHEKISKDELSGAITYRPLIDGAMSHKIGKDFEEVYYMDKVVRGNDVKYEMMTVGNSMKSCRTSRILPSRVPPNFEEIYK